MERIAIAHLLRARGNKGELAAEPLSDRRERFAQLSRVFAGDRELTVENTWWHGDRLIFKFAGIDSISDAETLGGLDVTIPASERIALEEGEYFLSDLVGCDLYDGGELVGRIDGWRELPGQILLTAGDLEIPFRRELLHSIDVAARRIDARLPEGLKDLNAP